MRKLLIVLAMAVFTSSPALAAMTVNIGINVPVYPNLQRIPGYPVYYAPGLHANYFFYDGLYWVYVPEGWYVSPWYDGPWDFVPIDNVPLFVLRVPVRYYGYPPERFRHWVRNEPPRWNAVWGSDWARRHRDWQRWNRSAAPAPAPLPHYQQRYTQSNYPNEVQRRELVQQHYRHAPRDAQVRPQWRAHVGETASPPLARQGPKQHQQHQQHQQQQQQQHRQPQPQPQAQALATRPQDTRDYGPRPVEREHAQGRGHAQQVHAPPPRPEPPRMQAAAPHGGPGAMHAPAEDRGPPRHANADQGGRPNKPDKGDKGDRGDKREH